MSTTGSPDTAAPTSPPPGWYPDPSGRHDLRRWDGGGWTADVRDRAPEPPAPAAPPAPPAVTPEPRPEPVAVAAEPPAELAPAATSDGPVVAGGALFQPLDFERFAAVEREAEVERLAQQEAEARADAERALVPPPVVEPAVEPAAAPADDDDGPKGDPLGGFDQLDTRTAKRLPPEARATTGAGVTEPVGRGRLLAIVGVGLVVVALVGWGLRNLQSAEQWRDRSQAAEAELADRISNYEALEQSLGDAASRGAQLQDSQETLVQLTEATVLTVDQIGRCASTLNRLIAAIGTSGQQAAIDDANRTCEAAVVNGEALNQVLEQLQVP